MYCSLFRKNNSYLTTPSTMKSEGKKKKVLVLHSHAQLLVRPYIVACLTFLPMGFSRQE